MRLVEANKQINISHEGGFLKRHFKGIALKIFKYHMMRTSKGLCHKGVVFTLQRSPKISKSNLESRCFKDLGKSVNLNKTISELESRRTGSWRRKGNSL